MPVREHLWDSDTDARPWDETQRMALTAVGDLIARLHASDGGWSDRLRGVRPDSVLRLSDLNEIPFTTKEDLRSAQTEIIEGQPLGAFQAAPIEDISLITSSSGTTGAPVYFGVTAHDRARWANAVANAYWTAGVRPSSVVALTTGMPMVAGGLPYAEGIQRAGGALAWMGAQPMSRMADAMQRLKVSVLVGTASFSAFFAQRCEEELGIPATELNVRTVIGGGEPGLGIEEIRDRVAHAWAATRVSEIMGLGDVLPAMWAECRVGRGMHFTAGNDVLVELIDPDTLEHVLWTPGARGEAVYTTLTRQASPVVRFRSRDHMEVTSIECPCGRTSPTVRCVGRTDDMLIYKAMNVFPSAIRDVALHVGGDRLSGIMRVRKEHANQVRFDKPIPVEIEVVGHADSDGVTALMEHVAEAIRQQLRVRVQLEAVPAGSIPVGEYKNALTYVP